jgi:HEAT repeats
MSANKDSEDGLMDTASIRGRPRLLIAGMVALALAGEATGDEIILRGGGQIRGVVVPDPTLPDYILVQTERLTTPIKYRKGQVVEVVPGPSPLKEYLSKRDKTGQGAQEQFDLGVWCEEQKLKAYADLHYQHAIEADSTFAPAHQKLGHVLYSGRWLTSDELHEAQGFVKHRGKWISLEEKAKIDADKVSVAEQAAWARRINVLRQTLLFGTPERQRDAELQLADIRDPAAVNPLVRIFGDDTDSMRTMLARILGGIPGSEAAAAIVNCILAEADAGVRQAAMDELASRDDPNVVPLVARYLQSKDLAIVNRAAWVLGNLKAVSTVPKLLTVLVSVDQQIVWVPPEPGANIAPGAPQIGASFVSGGGPFLPLINSVAVAPGAVGFGASSYPLFTGSGITLAEPPGMTRGYQPKIMSYTYRNVEVLNALEKLTGRNFGYDLNAWKHWVSTSFRPDPQPARRVPQP